MTDPLQFDFSPYEVHAEMVDAFVAAHPGSRYVVLDVQDSEQLVMLLRDLKDWPEHGILSPCQENVVHAKPVAVLGTSPAAVIDRLREQALLLERARALATLMETNPGAGRSGGASELSYHDGKADGLQEAGEALAELLAGRTGP